ncbi:MAG: hypothetical protein QM759_13055 [Terricaulis sp.]
MSNSSPASYNRVAPLDLWRCVGEFLETLIVLFGMPGEIAWALVHTAAERKLLLTWLRAAEAMMRRMLLIEASRHLQTNTPSPLSSLSPLSPAQAQQGQSGQRRQCISFHCFVGGSRATPRRASKRKPPRRFIASATLAARFEALLRAYEDPAPFARRLSRRLRKAPRRAIAMLAAPEGARYKIGEAPFSQMTALCGPMVCADSS